VRIKHTQLPAAKVSNPSFGEKSQNSPGISKGISKSGICKFESPQVGQAVRRFRNWPLTIAEKPANGGLLQFGRRSPDSQSEGLRGKIVQSLRRFFEIFPFSEDGDWRPGSIYTGWRGAQSLVVLIDLKWRTST
jgi:hypothetical protein